MQFHRLRLSGFKSFVEPAELHIEPGLTGVVGPNGCGKSNLLEAIRWVMGEGSAKSLRGDGMDDVIFAGSAGRPPRDFAEVTLFARDANGQHLEITRRIERGAGSIYRINGRDTRARDVMLLFADAATGAHSPALVSQGRIAAVIAAKPAERRSMLEEAAGIRGLHVRRRDAESRLRATEANLARLQDLAGQLESRMATLRRQARTAQQYRELSASLRVAEARTLYAHWQESAKAADDAAAKAKNAETHLKCAQEALFAAQRAQASAAQSLTDAREALSRKRESSNLHSHQVAALKSRLEDEIRQISALEAEHTRLEKDCADADLLASRAGDTIARLMQSLTECDAGLQTQEATLTTLGQDKEAKQNALQNAELTLTRARTEQAGLEAEWRIATSRQEAITARLARLTDEKARFDARIEALPASASLDLSVASAKERCLTISRAVALAHQDVENAAKARQSAQAAYDSAASALAAAKAELAGTEHEHKALVRSVELRRKQSHALAVIDQIRVEPGYERAVAAVLGRYSHAPAGPASADDGEYWTGASVPDPVQDHLGRYVHTCPEELAARLALVHVAEADDGRALPPGEWLVTLSGQLRRWDGLVIHGDGLAEATALEADNRLALLSEILPRHQHQANAALAAQKRAADDLAEAHQKASATDLALRRAADEERTALRAFDEAEHTRRQHVSMKAEIEAALATLLAEQQGAQDDLDQAKEKWRALRSPRAEQQAVAALEAEADTLRKEVQAASARLAACEQAIASLREQRAGLRAEIKGWQARTEDAATRMAGMAERVEETAQNLAIARARVPATQREIEAANHIFQYSHEDVSAAETALEALITLAEEADAALALAQETMTTAREERASLTAHAEFEESRRREHARKCGERFSCPPPILPEAAGLDETSVKEASCEQAAMEQISRSRDRLGPVNLVAADELAEIEQNHDNAVAERADLTEAVNRLRGSIGNLNREGRERLNKAFTMVNERFQQLFSELFEGGQAYLALVDSDDPLQAGLEIYAQPPGKRLQSLTLLSGGEQALTAIALIFALFLTNPAPICVLDEVDAPLDDANVDRFCDLLGTMVKQTSTRFLIVTHNAFTMSRMNRLFGVTMVEKGISRLVSVSLDDAEDLLAAE